MADLNAPRILDSGVALGRAVLPMPPVMWSYSSLKEVETCPLRYSLSRADYPDLWEQHGYPRLPVPAAIRGDVVHGSLEIIVKALVKARCSSTRSADAVAVLRELGGYTRVAESVLIKQLDRFEGNPRLNSDRQKQLRQTLTDWIPEARKQIQTYITRMKLHPSSTSVSVKPTMQSNPAMRYPVQAGDHPEKELIIEDLRFKGRIDLLSVDPQGAAITDFKTGMENPAHQDQLRTYALLWDGDTTANPQAMPVVSLTVAYPDHEANLAVPSPDELTGLRDEVAARIEAADTATSANPPAATLGEHCNLCNVKGHCATYWATGIKPTADIVDGAWYDLSGTVIREHGVKSWVLREAHTDAEVLVRTPTPSFSLPQGSDIRILGAKRTIDPDEEETLIATLNRGSEVLILTE